MKIEKYYYHKGSISELASRYPQFSKLKSVSVSAPNLLWRDTSNGVVSHHIQVAFFGKSGYGKSSTVNSFFGKSILKTSDVEACTRRCETLDYELSKNCFLSFSDFPGIGESEYRDEQYLEMYSNFLSTSTVVVYLLRADQRDYSIDESAYKSIFLNQTDRSKVIFAINYCDKIEPINRFESNEPSSDQKKNIDIKIKTIESIFKPVNLIVPYSAATSWNLGELASAIVKQIIKSPSISFHRTHPTHNSWMELQNFFT